MKNSLVHTAFMFSLSAFLLITLAPSAIAPLIHAQSIPYATTTVDGIPPSTQSCTIQRTLVLGSRGADVTCLQRFLIAQNLLSADSATGYFGKLTEKAVKRYQTKQGIVSSGSSKTTGYGVVGTRTRAAITASLSLRASPPVRVSSLISSPIPVPALAPPTPTSIVTPVYGGGGESHTAPGGGDSSGGGSGGDGGTQTRVPLSLPAVVMPTPLTPIPPTPPTPAFSTGDRVQATANLNVRSTASASGSLVKVEPSGSLGTVVAGPTTANGHQWWQIAYDDGTSGWSVQDDLLRSTAPTGYLDGLAQGAATPTLQGWAYDPKAPSQSIPVHIYVDAPAGSAGSVATAVDANQSSADVDQVRNITGNHRFTWQIPSQYLGGTHTFYVYAINTQQNADNPLITNAPMTIRMPQTLACAAYPVPLCPPGYHIVFGAPDANSCVVTPPKCVADNSLVWQPPAGARIVELLQDTDFTKGFRALWSCAQFSGDQPNVEHIPAGLRLGDCLSYKQAFPGFPIRTLPDTGVPSDQDKFWSLTEGYHTSGFGTPNDAFYVPPGQDLQIFRMEANALIISNTPNLLWYQHMNNIGLSPSDPAYNKKLVRTYQSDRHGSIVLYSNTKNEIQNDALDNGSAYANDTWPHFLVGQNFKQLIDLAQFSKIDFSETIGLSVHTLSGWSGSYNNATFSMAATLRRKDNPFIAVFIGYSPFSLNPTDYQENIGVEQNNQGFYRGSVNAIGGPLVVGESPRTITFDIIAALNKAIALKPSLGQVSDYYLADMGFGWEVIGYQEYRSDISNVSLMGTLR